ncbi:p53 apoptosis effector related to PMP-22 [Varanus komodoensis]|uniref:p53 apoptosis effector related to PMP-22 n=1 Tax=Varanus komodoensis TaxID=61221 RepID=A0A8D2JDV8_VARKO|nr:p53 apoptosis effector related to PMP-22-like [Varanus komodoensis]KAF7254097.1 p53 apoptosis effector related to PMP-22 [Varanus komodoensis]
MVKYGLDYTRCRWILPLLLGLAMIFGIIALAGWGWLYSQTLPFIQYASLWRICSLDNGEQCRSLMNYAWGRAAAATFLVGFVLVVICFALSIIAFAIPTLRFNFIRGIGGLCFVAAVFAIMGLVIYPVTITKYIAFPANTVNEFGWAYGFGWTMCLMAIGLGFFFCCLPLYEDQILGNVKPYYYPGP